MTEISAAMVKDLREKTGVGMMDCKKALAETKGASGRQIRAVWLARVCHFTSSDVVPDIHSNLHYDKLP